MHFIFPAGYTGRDCEIEIDECESNPCQNGGTCTNLVGAYECECVQEYYGDNCENKIDNCEFNNTCQNGATCVDDWMSITCECPVMFTGPNCEKGMWSSQVLNIIVIRNPATNITCISHSASLYHWPK